MKKNTIQARTDTLVYIDVNKISNHYGNPRKGLGDLTELAESIKVNGVLQNLTVVPEEPGYCPSCVLYNPGAATCRDGYDNNGERPPCSKWESKGTYIAVIGNRRLAAAKLAGLTSVPCIVSSMDKQEQMRTMLMENMHRSDLTVYEQAQGFQMMLNMGDTVEDVAKDMGFSVSTVRRRVKLLELDKETFKKSEARGATMFDYMELDKIKSVDRKNEVLEEIGTDNFKYKLKQAISAEAAEERLVRWVEALSAFATQVDSDTGYTQVKYYSTYGEPDVERPADAGEVEYFFNIDKYGSARLLRKGVAPKPKEDPEEVKRREHLEWRRNQLAEAAKRTYELRKEFAEAVSTACVKKHLAEIIAFSLWAKYDNYNCIDEDDVLELLDIKLREATEDGEDDEELTYDMALAVVDQAPEKMLWKMVCAETCDGANQNYYQHWSAEYCENKGLDQFYALLVRLGYKMSDEEKAR